MSHQRFCLLLLGLGLASVLITAGFLLFGESSPPPQAGRGPVSSTLDPHFSPSEKALPPAAAAPLAFAPSPGAFNNEFQPAYAPSAPPPPPAVRTVEPDQPGNAMHYGGKVVTVAQVIPSGSSQASALAVDIAPAAASSAPSRQPTEPQGVLDREEQLFRAKWGWAATDQIKSAAISEAEDAR